MMKFVCLVVCLALLVMGDQDRGDTDLELSNQRRLKKSLGCFRGCEVPVPIPNSKPMLDHAILLWRKKVHNDGGENERLPTLLFLALSLCASFSSSLVLSVYVFFSSSSSFLICFLCSSCIFSQPGPTAQQNPSPSEKGQKRD